jgi:hypothetical protein
MSQFRAFIQAALKHKQIEQATTLQHVALGAQGTGKAIKEAD